MNNEFKKVKNNSETRYVLETASAGSTSAGSVASVTGSVGKVQKRDNILAQEAGKEKEAPKPRNFVAKNAKMGGAGAHKDKKKAQKQGTAKHKKPYAESIDALKNKLNTLKEAFGRRDAYQRDQDNAEYGMNKHQSRAYRADGGGNDERHDLDPTDWYFVKDGKMFAVSVYPNQEQEARARGYSRTRDEAKAKASEQGVVEGSGYDGSEPLDLSTNPSVNDVFKRALYIYDYEGYGNDGDYSEDDAIDQYVARKFGQDVLDQLTNARNQKYFGRDGGNKGGHIRSSNLGTSGAPGDKFRTTKAGKMHGQDAKMMKAKVADRLGRHPEPNLPEGDVYMESLAESLQQVLSEKAVSKKQQKFMGMVHAAQKGEKPASKEVAKVAKDMGKKDAKDFASTKHKGLPEKKKSKK
jgi:hypothetical protein